MTTAEFTARGNKQRPEVLRVRKFLSGYIFTEF
jgi:hypothetical protein